MAHDEQVAEPREPLWTPTWVPTWRDMIGLSGDGPTG